MVTATNRIYSSILKWTDKREEAPSLFFQTDRNKINQRSCELDDAAVKSFYVELNGRAYPQKPTLVNKKLSRLSLPIVCAVKSFYVELNGRAYPQKPTLVNKKLSRLSLPIVCACPQTTIR
jgi:hypothetical protein